MKEARKQSNWRGTRASARKCIDAVKLDTLKRSTREGWVDISEGRYIDVADDRLEGLVEQLGRRAKTTR